MEAESLPAGAASRPDLLMRAAVLSVFDVDWIRPDPADGEDDELLDFLFSSCERVIDTTGTRRWQLRDDKRVRVLRGVPKDSLRAAMNSMAVRPHDPVQAALEHFLSGSLPPLDQLDPAGLSGVLQVEQWVGQDPGLPAPSDIQARLDRKALTEPLRRLLAHGFFGREDLLDALRSFIERPPASKTRSGMFLIEGAGGCGKSTVLARLILNLPAHDDLAVYISLDRGWLIDGGPWAIFDEIVRQVGVQHAERRGDADDLRQQLQQLAARAGGFSDVASRGSQQRDQISSVQLRSLATLLAGRGRLVVVLDTLEELARRDESMAAEIFGFLNELSRVVAQIRVIAAGRSLPGAAFGSADPWPLTGLEDSDARDLLRTLTAGTDTSDELIGEVIRLLGGNPLSLYLAADVLKRTGDDPTQLIRVAEGNVQGQLYSRLLEHIRDPQVRAVAHPGLIVRRITAGIIRDVLAGPCGLPPLDNPEAERIFEALRTEATLCEPSPDGDGALVHRQDVRALMLPSIQQDSPGTTRAIHEAAVRYYQDAAEGPAPWLPVTVARREELYHRLMLNQERRVLDRRWLPAVGSELSLVMDELPPRSQLYLTITVNDRLRLNPEIRAQAADDEWQHVVRPAAAFRMERGKVAEALELVRERRGSDGQPLLPDLEIEALERLERYQGALSLVREEQERASRQGSMGQVRVLKAQEARILERMGLWSKAWTLLDDLAALDRDRRARTATLDDEVRLRELVVLTSILRIARHEKRWYRRVMLALTRIFRITRRQRRVHRPVSEVTRETVDLAKTTPPRLLAANPSLLRDLAAEIGPEAPEIVQLAVTALATQADGAEVGSHSAAGTEDIGTKAAEGAPAGSAAPATEEKFTEWSNRFSEVSDASQGYRQRRRRRRPALLARFPRLFWRPREDRAWAGDWPAVAISRLAEYPTLAPDLAVWMDRLEPRFRVLDHRAQILQNEFWRQQVLLIAGGLAATALGTAQAALGGGVLPLAVGQAVLTGLLAVLVVLAASRRAQSRYLSAWLRAERIKSEFFLFLARADDYAHGDPVARLNREVDRIEAADQGGEGVITWSNPVSGAFGTSPGYRQKLRSRRPALLARFPRLFWRPAADREWSDDWPVVGIWHLEEYPTLAPDLAVWVEQLEPRFRVLDHRAQILQNEFWRQQVLLISGGLAATALATAQAALGGGVLPLAVGQAVLTGLLAGLVVLITSRRAQRRYRSAWLRAERIKSEFFLFLARVDDYAGEDRVVRLQQEVDHIEAAEVIQ